MTQQIVKKITRPSRLLRLACFAIAVWMSTQFAIAQDVSADVQFDVLRHRLIEAIKIEDHRTTLKLVSDLRAMNRPLVADVSFFEANAYLALGREDEGEAALKRYVETAGPKGANYKPAIAMLSKILAKKEAKAEVERRAEAERQRRADAHAKMLATSVRIGQVKRINTEWNYAVVAIDTNADPGNNAIYVLSSDGNRVDLKPGKLTGNELSATTKNVSMLQPGMIVYQGPAGAGADLSTSESLATLGPTVVMVSSVAPGSPAAASGYQAGDIIVSVYIPEAKSELRIRNKAAFIGLSGRIAHERSRQDAAGGAASSQSTGMLVGLAMGGLLATEAKPATAEPRESAPSAMPALSAALFAQGTQESAITRSYTVKIRRGQSEFSVQGMNIDGLVLDEVATATLPIR